MQVLEVITRFLEVRGPPAPAGRKSAESFSGNWSLLPECHMQMYWLSGGVACGCVEQARDGPVGEELQVLPASLELRDEVCS